ncbi:PEST proteolytic signal-containing nuclear protein isoform X2 [Dendroctonus ponderosae]|uniref:PEST proteolytic signal-containing nuclear protein n=1 Tax=Dendroctonus ponderosae TaxID=77166 RepID=A0AAR5QIP1_DENPD|nr:PEST proteolytic signal-containing nuclear protein isoform X2 [Dendroctonus ponderosae]
MCLLGSSERSRSRSPLGERTVSSKDKPQNIGLAAKNRLKNMSIQMKLNSSKPAPANKPKLSVAAAFSQDSDDEPEEMPPEAKMRMRNIGRNTPTSSGPNSFGKTKHGFSDAKKIFEKNLREAMEAARADD